MTDDPNRRIGDYEVLGVLGAGGMGKVFKVRNVISDRVEAMKVLLPDLAGRQELADRFLREIKLLASLDHPNIAQLRTALTLSNRLVMVMEYVEGTTLAARLEQGPIPAAEAVGYMKQVLGALAYAHGRNVIHRDIKPANMMLTPTGTVKLMDFGIARASGDASMTVTGTTLGSLYYMSPEQVKGSAVDARSDLYSLGVSLYEMVTGQTPFKASSDYSIMTAQLQERPKPPSELQPGLPPQLNGIILHAMAKEPADRFQNAEEFAQALDGLGLIVSAPVPVAAAVAQPLTPVPMTAPPTTATMPAPVSATMSMPAPPPPTQAMPAPSVMDLSPKPHKGRGLYMTLGAAVVLIVLVLAGISFPRWMKTRANEQKQADQNASSNQSNQPNSNSTTSNPPPSDSGNSSTAKPDDSGNSATSGNSAPNASSSNSNPPDSGSSDKSANSGSSDNSSNAGNSSSEGSTTAKNSGAKKPSKSKGSSGSSGNSSNDQGSTTASSSGSNSNSDQGNSSADAASKAELEGLEQDVDQTSSRSNAVSGSLDNMRRSLTAQGLNLRGDIASAEELMKINLDKAQQAMQNHDAKGARKYLNLAQGNLQKIEKFLGH